MALEFAARIGRIPVYPAAAGYSLGPHVALLASNESPFAPLPQVLEAAQRSLAGVNRYPDPSYAALRRALADRYGVPRSRIVVGNGSCDVLLAAGEALLEPGAEGVYALPSFSGYPPPPPPSRAPAIQGPPHPRPPPHPHPRAAFPGPPPPRRRSRPRGDRGPARPRAPPRPRRDGRRDHRRHAARDRLQPEQPDVDGAAARRDRGVPRAGAAPRRGDRRRGLRRVRHPRGSRRLAAAAQAAPEPRPAADVLEGPRPRRAAGRVRALWLRGAPHGRRPGPPALLRERCRAGRRRRGAQAPG